MKQKVNFSKDYINRLINSSRLQAQLYKASLTSSKNAPSAFFCNGFKISPFFYLSENSQDLTKRLGWYVLPVNSPCIFYFTCPSLAVAFAKKYSPRHTPSYWLDLYDNGLYSFLAVVRLIDDNPLISWSYEG